MSSDYLRYAVVLGLVALVGPFAIDMYLPALPTIAADLEASTAATQMTLMAYFVVFALLQIVYGPITDRVGRKPPLYFGLAVFAIGSIGAGLSPSIDWLIGFRALQGAGASALMVVPRAVVRDLYTGYRATRLMSLIMLVISVSPMLAPLTGSALIVPFGWRATFFAVTAVALISLAVLTFGLRETLAGADRVPINVRNLLAGYGKLFRDPGFLGLTFVAGLGMASFFVFLATSSFLYIEHYGLTPTEFALAFAGNAIGFFAATQLAATFGRRYGSARVVRLAVIGFAAFTVGNLAATLSGIDNLYVLIAFIFGGNACLGLVIPTAMVLALEEHGPIAGMASALGGTLQMMTGAFGMIAVSFVFDGTPLAMVAMIAACGIGALAISLLVLGRLRPPLPTPAQ